MRMDTTIHRGEPARETGLTATISSVAIEHPEDDGPDCEGPCIGVRASATIEFHQSDGVRIVGTSVVTPGLWGVEADAPQEYLADIAREEVRTLADMLMALGFTEEAIGEAIEEHLAIWTAEEIGLQTCKG